MMNFLRESLLFLLFLGLVFIISQTECRKIKRNLHTSTKVNRIKKELTNMIHKQYNDVRKESNKMLEHLLHRRKEIPGYGAEHAFEHAPVRRPPGLWVGRDDSTSSGIPTGLWGGDSKVKGIPTGLWGGDAKTAGIPTGLWGGDSKQLNDGLPGLWSGDETTNERKGLPGLWSGDTHEIPGLWKGDAALPGLWTGDALSKSDEHNALPGLWSGDVTSKGLPGLWSGDSQRDTNALPGLWSGDSRLEKSGLPGLWSGDAARSNTPGVWGDGNNTPGVWGDENETRNIGKSHDSGNKELWGKRGVNTHVNDNDKVLEGILSRLIKQDMDKLSHIHDKKNIK